MTLESGPALNGRPVVDAHMDGVGKVTDVIYDDRTMEAQMVVVKTGILGGEHYVPLVDSYLASDGRLVIPFDKVTIKHSPRADTDHVLRPETEREVHEYFNVAA